MPALFWKSTLGYRDRLTIATFSYVNGLAEHLLVEWCELQGSLSNDGIEGIKYLYNKFENTNEFDKKYYQWNVAMGRDMYIGGDTHYY